MSDTITKSAQNAPPAAAALSQIALARQKYGCTCSECTGGYLSPRMRWLLETQAGLAMDIMRDLGSEDGLFTDDESLCKPGFVLNCDFVPSSVYDDLGRGVTRPFFHAYASVFEAAYELLHLTPPRTFNAEVLNSYAHTSRFWDKTEEFFEACGIVEYVIDAITQNALTDHLEAEVGWSWEDKPEYLALPECKNDLNFGLVRECLGLSRDVEWGPYQFASGN